MKVSLPLLSKQEIMFLAILFLLAVIYGALCELLWLEQLKIAMRETPVTFKRANPADVTIDAATVEVPSTEQG